MEKKDVKVDLPSDVLKAKGLDTLDKLEGALGAADQAVSDKKAREERITELEGQVSDLESQPEPEPVVTPEKPPQEWGLGNDAEQHWQQDQLQGRGYQTMVGTAQAIAQKLFDEKTKPLKDRLVAAEEKILKIDIMDSIADQSEQATVEFGAEWLEKHRGIAEKKLGECIKEGRALNKDELMTELMRTKMKEDKVSPDKVAAAVGDAKGNAAFAEDEGDANTSTNVDMGGRTVEDMEKVLPHADVNKPIEEGD